MNAAISWPVSSMSLMSWPIEATAQADLTSYPRMEFQTEVVLEGVPCLDTFQKLREEGLVG